MQIAFRLRDRNALTQHSIKKYEYRDAHVCRTMNKHRPLIESLHYPAEHTKIPCRGSFEIHRDVHVRHPQARDDASLVRKGVVRCRQGQIDDRLKPGLANPSKLFLCRLPGSAEPAANVLGP